MTYYLLAVFAAFCAAMGFGLSSNQVGIWGVFAFSMIGVLCLEVAYFLTSVLLSLRK